MQRNTKLKKRFSNKKKLILDFNAIKTIDKKKYHVCYFYISGIEIIGFFFLTSQFSLFYVNISSSIFSLQN